MPKHPAISALTLDFVIADSVHPSQRWILFAMKSHGPGLVAMLWRMLANEQDVCDAYQQTFLQIANYDFGSRPRHVKAYLYRTAANIAVTMIRHRQLQQKSGAVLSEHALSGGNRITDDNDYIEQLDAAVLQEKLRQALASLPQHLRNVIVLRDLAELSYDQIEKIIGISAKTARVYRCRAITLLAAIMAKKGD